MTPGLSTVLLLYYTSGITLYWIMAHEFTQNDYLITGLIFLASSMLVSAIGIRQYLVGDLGEVAWLDAEANPDIRARAYSVLTNPNVLGDYLIVVVMMNLLLIGTGKSLIRKALLFIPLGINTLTLLLTFSRGAWIGFAFAFLIMIIVYEKRWLPIIAIVGIFSLFLLPQVIVDRILTIFINNGDSSTNYRYLIWFGGRNILKDYWLFGTGLGYGSFSKLYSLYRMGDIFAAHAHNIFFELFVETGLFGLITFIYMILKAFVNGTKKIIESKNKYTRMIIITGIAALSGLFLHGLVENTLFDVRIITLIWVSLGFIMYRGDMEVE